MKASKLSKKLMLHGYKILVKAQHQQKVNYRLFSVMYTRRKAYRYNYCKLTHLNIIQKIKLATLAEKPQIFSSPFTPPNPISQSHPHVCIKLPAVAACPFSLSPYLVDHKDLPLQIPLFQLIAFFQVPKPRNTSW